MTPRRQFRYGVSANRKRSDGASSWGFGARVGYWPCLRAPYVQVAFGTRRLDAWYGYPSYR